MEVENRRSRDDKTGITMTNDPRTVRTINDAWKSMVETQDSVFGINGGNLPEFGSVSMEAVMDTVSRVYLGISLLGLTYAIMQGVATNVRQVIDGLFAFIKGALWFIPGMGQTYFNE